MDANTEVQTRQRTCLFDALTPLVGYRLEKLWPEKLELLYND
jgi:hypothetical protein